MLIPTPSPPSPPPAPPPTQLEDDLKYLIIPIVVVVVVMLLAVLVYFMAKHRHNRQVREIILALYDIDYDRDEWEPLNSYDHDSYNAMDGWQEQQQQEPSNSQQYNTSYV